jgi:hypothetical protein
MARLQGRTQADSNGSSANFRVPVARRSFPEPEKPGDARSVRSMSWHGRVDLSRPS